MHRALAAAIALLALAPSTFASVRGSSCTTDDSFLPGGTATMCWTCTSAGPTSPAPECLEQVALGYPDGWTVSCGTQDATSSAGHPVAFGCNAAGQTVTYSDTDGRPGELCPVETWSFCVDVTAPASFSEPVCVFYTLFGDGAGDPPHQIIDCDTCLPAGPAQGSVTIVKQTLPPESNGQLFDFTGDLGAFSLGSGQSTTLTDLSPGTYVVTETLPAGWDLTAITCDDPDGGSTTSLATATATVDLDGDEHVVCTFVNTARGSVTIVSQTVPVDAGGQLFEFSGDLGVFSLTGGQSTTLSDLVAGAYDVAQVIPVGWDLSAITCDDPDGGSSVSVGSATATVDLDPGEHVVCTFLNTARGSVTIVSETVPEDAGGQLFEFSGDLGVFSLTGGQSTTLSDLVAGAYDVAQAVPPGWDLSAITCDDPDGGSSVSVGSATATVDLDPGEHVVCTFLNTAQGSVTIAKETVPQGAPGQAFEFSGDLGPFSLSAGQSTTVTGLAPGVFTVTESLPAGWDLTAITCDDPDGGSTTSVATATATVDLDPGEHVTCTFLNTSRGSVTIVKETLPQGGGGQLFDFTGDLGAFSLAGGQSTTVTGLEPGAYDVTELLPAGWDLTVITCDDPDGGSAISLATATATIELDPGEHVTCTFVNVAQGSVTIAKETAPDASAAQTFAFTGDLGAFSLAGGESLTIAGLGPGTYAVTEVLPAGWDLTAIACDDPDGGTTTSLAVATATVELDPGEHVTCTFLNTAVGTSVTIAKDTLPRYAPQQFEFAGDLGPFTLTGTSSVTFTDLEPGSYAVSELSPPLGWTLIDITCEDPDGGTVTDLASGTATIDVDAGEQILCTFLNRSDDYVPMPIPALSTPGLLLLVTVLAVAGFLFIRHRTAA